MKRALGRAARHLGLAFLVALPLAAQTQLVTPGPGALPPARLDAIAVGDVDGDGDPDLAGSSPTSVLVYLNDGNGTFADVSPTHVTSTYGLRGGLTGVALLRDVDGDGDLDLFLGKYGGEYGGEDNELYVNDGSGRFADATARLPRLSWANTRGAAAGDFDGDGDVDLLCADVQILSPFPDHLLLNDGTGTFADATTSHLPARLDRSCDVAAGDVDGDGDLDLAFANAVVFGGGPAQNALYLNDGSGRFLDVSASHLPAIRRASWRVAAADIDGDGDQDLVWANGDGNEVWRNDGTGRFADATAASLPGSGGSYAVAAADVDEDGDVDLLFDADRLYLNDGSGRFTDASAARLPARVPTGPGAPVPADLDGDRDLDLLLPGDPPTLWVNRLRHVAAAGPAVLGQPYTLLFHAQAGFAAAPQLVFPFVGTTPAVPTIPVPPLGTFGLGPTGLVALPARLAPVPSGEVALTFPLPAAPALAGQALLAQSLVVHLLPTGAHLSNVHRDVLR